jgi:isopenicillin N synthase-like dioxygenase
MSYASARPLNTDSIPVIDLTPLRNGDNPDKVAHELHAASQNLGFIYVKGHGIPEQIIHAARASAFRFFRSTESRKATLRISDRHRGWLNPGASKMHEGAKTDLKESFIWGQQDAGGKTVEDHPMRGSNQWPDWVPEMQYAAMHYFMQAHNVAHELMRGFALGLGLQENFFLKHCQRPLSRASFVYYPAQDESCGEDQFGVAPHTDFGVLTVLCQDDTGGLQVEDINGDWIEAPPIPGTLVVNVGDLLSRWTNGAYKSTPHRVVNSSGRERLSLVLAFDPEPETVIDPRQIFGKSFKSDQPDTTCGDYLLWRFAKAFSYRNPSTTK